MKIWTIDLGQNITQLQNMYKKFENHDISWYKEAVKYTAEKGINTKLLFIKGIL